ncbi:GvpL/GvpF family gas vesicle protein [Streptomyces sp. TS71-3]|uniref:GvpL/GvpF family gas vesicle protein n=1 Tax=Streptomyces sp. TS71-3 TaxID=2733862 RepID=UPI001B1D2D7A|nr:GvpL/GvpF family gas vesicle protein [Streptomyces sp. TS71-3]GHJ37817.1 gas vesicle protein [Streptomyces sp. TS71-3]
MSTYVYGIAGRSHPGLPDGITGVGEPARPVRTVVQSGLTAVVSDAPEGLRPKRRDLMAHQRVLYRAEEDGPVLPMRFGSVAPDDASVRGVLAERGEHFHERLESLAGKVEYNVKATHREDAVLRYVMARRPDIRDLSDANNAAGGGNYRQRLELGELVVAAVQAQQAEDAELVYRTLEQVTASVTAGPEAASWVANVSFLVERKGTGAFTEAVDRLRADRPHLDLRLNGPLPPYSFVEPGPARPAVPGTSTGSTGRIAE